MRVLITRSQNQAKQWQQQLNAQGIDAFSWPCVEIKPEVISGETLNNLSKTEYFFFVSTNAVEHFFVQLSDEQKSKIQKAQCFAIGEATAKALKQQNCQTVHTANKPSNSEALLNLKNLQDLQNQNCVIIRGQSGRDYLAETLQQRGAQIMYIQSYERICPKQNIQPLIDTWQNQSFDCVLFTSLDGLQNLWQMLGAKHHHLLQATPITVCSEKMVNFAKGQGIEQMHFVCPPSIKNMLEILT